MKEIQFTINPKRIAAVATNALGRQMTTDHAEAFMLLYGTDMEDLLAETLKNFVTGKLK